MRASLKLNDAIPESQKFPSLLRWNIFPWYWFGFRYINCYVHSVHCTPKCCCTNTDKLKPSHFTFFTHSKLFTKQICVGSISVKGLVCMLNDEYFLNLSGTFGKAFSYKFRYISRLMKRRCMFLHDSSTKIKYFVCDTRVRMYGPPKDS